MSGPFDAPGSGPQGYGYRPPELWLEPGPQLPRRSWQRRSRNPVIVITVVASLIFATIGIGAIVGGLFSTSQFVAVGAMPAECSTEQAQVGDGTVEIGTVVRILDQSGGEAGAGTFDALQRNDSDCFLVFQVQSQVSRSGEYLVQVGDDLMRQTASEETLRLGIRLRP